MKLYNLYKEVILESVDIKDIQNTLNSNMGVNISYQDNSKDSNSGPRYCQVFALGKTSKGNAAIRVYQVSGPNLKRDKQGNTIHWKTFRVDRIESWSPTNFKFYAPPDGLYNALGDATLNISANSGSANMAIFGGKNLDKYRERHSQWQSNIDSKQSNEPLAKDREEKSQSYPEYDYTKYDKPEVEQPQTNRPEVKQPEPEPDYSVDDETEEINN
jgi:hypothetical protein